MDFLKEKIIFVKIKSILITNYVTNFNHETVFLT